MKKKELQELRTKEIKNLEKEAEEKKLEYLKFVAGLKASKEKDFKKGKKLRHDLSQILTIIREKELFASEEKGEVKDINEKKEVEKKEVEKK